MSPSAFVTPGSGITGAPPLAFSIGGPQTTTPANAPQITNVERLGYHKQITSFVLTFDRPLNPSRAGNVYNYQIVAQSGPNNGNSVAIKSAVYDPAGNTVTLLPYHPVYLYQYYSLTADAGSPAGISDTATPSHYLAGTPGIAGTNYTQTLGPEYLVGPNAPLPHGVRGLHHRGH